MKIKTLNIDNVKTATFQWCKGKGTFIKFTTLKSAKVFTGGWFHGIHPFYYNRDDFSDYVFYHLPDLKGKLDIYQKKVWKWNERKEKIITLAIVIDGDMEVKNEVFFCSIRMMNGGSKRQYTICMILQWKYSEMN